jgi:hypothetical protein
LRCLEHLLRQRANLTIAGSSAPGDFDDLEHSKSFVVNEVNGVNVMLMTTLTGVPERERAAAGVQVMIDQGYHTMYIYSDDRNPVSPDTLT